MDDTKVVRLAKPKKKGVMSFIFSRFLIIAILLGLQVFLYVAIFVWLHQYISHYMVISTLFTLAMVIYLFACSIDNSAKLTWMLIIAALPFFGAVLFWYTQMNVGHRVLRKKVEDLIDDTKNAIPRSDQTMKELDEDGGGTDDLSTYLCRSGCFPVFKNTKTRYFPLGENKFAAMLEELEKAEHFIFMEYFIVEEGYMWGRILGILIRKAKEGVDVRFMYDGMCEMSTLPPDYWKLLEKQGIKAKSFSPIKPLLSSHYNYRDHRKILVIDGKVAFTGGVNLADEYINRIERFGHWKDTAVMLEGDAVKSFTLLFLQMWNVTEKEPQFSPFLDDTGYVPQNAEGYVMPYGDCPLDHDKAGEAVYMDILNRAKDYVYIMTPYLILDGELETSLKFAAQRGVDVRLILPGIPDKKLAYALAKSHYKALNEAGVKIYEYKPGFVHAKVVLSDDVKAVVGTINLDYRSLYHHFECAAYMYKVPCIDDIKADFNNTLSRCSAVTAETIRHERMSYKILGLFMKFIAPLM